jgi:hypothetical protein
MGASRFHFFTNERDPLRVALLLPGRGYTVQGPLLRFAAHVLNDVGWTTRALVWDSEPTDAREVYAEVLRRAVADEPQVQHVVVGKSLGTLALPAAAALNLPGAWLTPILDEECAAELLGAVEAFVAADTPVLLAGGTADPLWDSARARASGATVVEIPDANHSLEVPGDWRRSVDALTQVTDAVARLAGEG